MGTYNEPRPPSGSPADGEKDVWLESGTVKWGHWNAATNAWVVDATADSTGLVGEKGATGDEGPPCPTGGNADTLDGYHASEITSANARGSWVDASLDTGHWELSNSFQVCKFSDGLVWMWGQIECTNPSGAASLGTITSDYRPVRNIYGLGAYYGSEANQGPVRIRIVPTGAVTIVNLWGRTLAAGGYLEFDFRYQSL